MENRGEVKGQVKRWLGKGDNRSFKVTKGNRPGRKQIFEIMAGK